MGGKSSRVIIGTICVLAFLLIAPIVISGIIAFIGVCIYAIPELWKNMIDFIRFIWETTLC